MNTKTFACPRDDYPLVPVYAVEGRQRRIIALACPEPYCDHMQLVPRDRARELERYFRHERDEPEQTVPVLDPDEDDPGPARAAQ